MFGQTQQPGQTGGLFGQPAQPAQQSTGLFGGSTPGQTNAFGECLHPPILSMDGSDLTPWHLHLFSRIAAPRRDQVLQEELSEPLPGLLGSNNRLDLLSELQGQRVEVSLEVPLLVSLSHRTQTFPPYTTS
jgi:hypothetical protein